MASDIGDALARWRAAERWVRLTEPGSRERATALDTCRQASCDYQAAYARIAALTERCGGGSVADEYESVAASP
jgi:hypothetical protein